MEKGREGRRDGESPPPDGCPHLRGRRRGSAAADPRFVLHVELHDFGKDFSLDSWFSGSPFPLVLTFCFWKALVNLLFLD